LEVEQGAIEGTLLDMEVTRVKQRELEVTKGRQMEREVTEERLKVGDSKVSWKLSDNNKHKRLKDFF